MKRNNWHSKVVVAFLMVVAVLFGAFAVTAFAATSNDASGTEAAKSAIVGYPAHSVELINGVNGGRDTVKIAFDSKYAAIKGLSSDDLAEVSEEVMLEAARKVIYRLIESYDASAAAKTKSFIEVFLGSHFNAGSVGSLSSAGRAALVAKLESFADGGFNAAMIAAIDDYVNNGALTEGAKSAITSLAVRTITSCTDALLSRGEISVNDADKIKAGAADAIADCIAKVENMKAKGSKVILSTDDVKLSALQALTVDSKVLYADGAFDAVNMTEIVKNVPSAEKIASMTDEELGAFGKYSVSYDFVYGSYKADVAVGFVGRYDYVRTLAVIYADRLGISVSGGVYSLDLNFDEGFASMVFGALNKVAETNAEAAALRGKVIARSFAKESKLEVLLAEIDISTLIRIFETIDFTGALTRDHVHQYVDYTNLQIFDIINAVENYEGYYNNLKNTIRDALYLLPDSFGNKTISEIYQGNGKFYSKDAGDLNVERLVEKTVERLSRELPEIYSECSDIIDTDAITDALEASSALPAQAEFSMTFTDIYQVEFVVDGQTFSKGFLTSGAELETFGRGAYYKGYAVNNWKDANFGNVENMPSKDIKVNGSVLNCTSDISEAYTFGKIYELNVFALYPEVDEAVTYRWYKNGEIIEGASTGKLALDAVADSGEYKCVVKAGPITDNCIINVDIYPVAVNVYDFIKVIGNNNENSTIRFTYEKGTASGYEIVIPEKYADVIKVTLDGDALAQTEVGSYKCRITFTSDADKENIFFTNGETSATVNAEWEIFKKIVDVSGIKVQFVPIKDGEFVYDSSEFGYDVVADVPDGVVIVTKDARATKPGDYVAVYELVAENSNYELVGEPRTGSKAWSIAEPYVIDAEDYICEVGNVNGGSGLLFNYASGVVSGYEIKIPDEYADKIKVEFSADAIKQENAGKYVSNITFTIDKGTTVFTNGEFTITVTVEWEIARQYIDISGAVLVPFGNYVDGGFIYDSKAESGYRVELPEHLKSFVNIVYNGTNTAKNVGNYYFKYSLELAAGVATNYTFGSQTTEFEQSWSIAPKVVDVSGIKVEFVPLKSGEFVYNGEELGYTVKAELPEGVAIKVDGASGINAGDYTLSYTFVPFDQNYELVGEPLGGSKSWSIAKKEIDISEAVWDYEGEFEYDGKEHSVSVVFDEDIAQFFDIVYKNNRSTVPGTFTATATVALKAAYAGNYAIVGEIEALEWTVFGTLPPKPNGYTDKWVVIETNPNLPDGAMADVDSAYDDYAEFDFSDLLGSNKKGTLIVAYDISYKDGKDTVAVNGNYGKFSIKFAIPEQYDDCKEIVIFHILADGTVEKIESEVVDGWVEFEADSFSVYAMVASENDYLWLILLIIGLIVLILVIVLIVTIVKRIRRKRALIAQLRAEAGAVNNQPVYYESMRSNLPKPKHKR